jgi:hypothetical protein
VGRANHYNYFAHVRELPCLSIVGISLSWRAHQSDAVMLK